MKRLTEKSKPSKSVLELLLKSKSEIYPDVEYLKDWYNNYSTNHINRLSFDLQYLMDEFSEPNDIKVLELGSVPPVLTNAIHKKGYKVTGFDIGPERFNNCIINNKLIIVKGTIGIEKLPFDNNSFDAIIMNEVFEHLNTNLIEVIEDIKRILKPGGRLFISTPNLKSMVGIKNFLLHGKAYSCCSEIYDEYDKIEKFGHMGHVREYTPSEIIIFFNKMGLKTLKLIYRGKYPLKYRILEILAPRLKPFFTLIATKDQ